MSIQDLFDNCENDIRVWGSEHSITVDWSYKGKGWGQLIFYKNKAGQLTCANECLNKDAIKKILNMMVDLCELEDRHCPTCGSTLMPVSPGDPSEDIQYCRCCFKVEP